MPERRRLQGKTAIVTGAASGQGRAVTLAYLAEGAHVLAFDCNAEGLADLSTTIEGGLSTFTGDVSDEPQVKSAVQRAIDDFGSIDIIYNNAGVYLRGRGDGASDELELDVWNAVLAINATSAYLTVKHGVGHLKERGGSIINVASIGGIVGSDCHAYSASKGAMLALTRSQALTYAKFGIRVNAIAPGVVDTPMATPVTATADVAARYRQGTPLGRFAVSEDIAPLAVYLASDESTYLTGTTIPVDGGLTIRP